MTWTPTQRVAVGRKKQQAGSLFELWIDIQHSRAKADGILVYVEHNQPESRIVRGQRIFTKKSGCDYSGILSQGRSLAAECKSTSATCLMKSAVGVRQVQHLDAAAKAGALALLLVEFSRTQKRFAVPWLSVPWTVKRTAESVSEEALVAWDVSDEWCYLRKFVR